MATERGSLYEPNEKRPEWALSPEQFTKLKCEECKQPFQKDGANGVKGGLLIFYDDTVAGGKLYFHGYLGQAASCYAKAEKRLLEEKGGGGTAPEPSKASLGDTKRATALLCVLCDLCFPLWLCEESLDRFRPALERAGAYWGRSCRQSSAPRRARSGTHDAPDPSSMEHRGTEPQSSQRRTLRRLRQALYPLLDYEITSSRVCHFSSTCWLDPPARHTSLSRLPRSKWRLGSANRRVTSAVRRGGCVAR